MRYILNKLSKTIRSQQAVRINNTENVEISQFYKKKYSHEYVLGLTR